MTTDRRVFLFLYLLSGAAALLYEVLWLRLLTLSMGHTAAAVGIVLAAFMGGLAIGAWAAGRAADQLTPARALRAYAALEGVIALCALLLPSLLAAVQPLLAGAYANGDGARTFHLTLGGAALLLLAVPAAAMGATYPVAVRASMSRDPAAGAAGLYAANTIGATAGAALAGFLLLPSLGLRASTWVGVALNVAAAFGALWLARRKAPPNEIGSEVAGRTATPYPATVRVAAMAAGVSGLIALVLQVMWTRILALVLGPTTYAFSAMLVAFISGIAIGSTLAVRIVRRTRTPGAWLAGTLTAAGAAALAAALAVDRLPLVVAPVAAAPDSTFGSILILQLALVAVVLLPMTVALGAAFPFALALAAPDPARPSRAVSLVYAVNTVGAIAGALGGSLVLLPAIGIQASIRAAAAAAALTGALVWIRTGAGGSGRSLVLSSARLAAPILVVALAWMLPPWNEERIANGGYRFSPALAAGDVQTGLEAGRLVYYREGAAGTVSVRALPGALALAIDGKVDASNGGDMLTQKLLAHLPLLLHPDPRTVGVIGLGSGVTIGAALRHPVARVDVVEISPEVVDASRFFARENHDALADPRTRLVVGDGRAHLLLSGERYDVIISEPSNPWMAGVATLFTRQFFLAARERLAPGGILTQWAHTYSIADEDLRAIVATFLSVFPDGTAWLVGEADLLLVGSTAPLRALDDGLAAAWSRPGVAADLSEVSIHDPFALFAMYVGRAAELRQYAGDARIEDDDRVALEYSAPRALYGAYAAANVRKLHDLRAGAALPAAVIAARERAGSGVWRDLGRMLLQADAPGPAYDAFKTAVAGDPRDTGALVGFVSAAARAGRLADAEAVLAGVAAESGVASPLVQLSAVLALRGRLDEATDVAREAVLEGPTDEAALEQLASMYAERGDADALGRLASVVEQLAPAGDVGLYTRARLALLQQDYAQAARLGESLAAAAPANAAALSLAGSAWAALGDHEAARRALEGALRRAPRDPLVLSNLGMTQLRLGNSKAAREYFEDALYLAPTLESARNGLADLRQRRIAR